MSSEIQIRDATPEDAPPLAYIQHTAMAAGMPWLTLAHTAKETVQWMAGVLPTRRVRVAMIDGTIVGFCATADGWLLQLYVSPIHQSRGVGALLFRDVCASASAPFRFWVFQRNAGARRFYERHGSRLICTTGGRDNEEREPDALYEWSVPRRIDELV